MSNTKDTPMDYKQFEGHTPGPWESGEAVYKTDDGYGKDVYRYSGHIKRVVSTCDSFNKVEAESNAKLIAAAPDLLKENQELKLELQKQKELNAELVNAIRVYVFQMDKFFGEPKVGQPPGMEKFRELIKKSSEI